jgi:ParB/RepB/Spo0J family partition protein
MPRQRGGAATAPSRPSRSAGGRVPKVGDVQLQQELAKAQQEATEAAAAAAAGAPVAGVEILQLPVDKVAPHPLNPAHRHAKITPKLEELAAGIREVGQLEPSLVASVDTVLSHSPELRDKIPADAEWVTLAGHRRWAANKLAEMATMPSVLRNDLADPVSLTIVFLQENRHRDAITPIEEAVGFKRLQDAGLSEREIARRSGVSQPYVHQTLKLLQLDEPMRDALTGSVITVTDARRLLEIKDADRRNKMWTEDIEPHLVGASAKQATERNREQVELRVRETQQKIEDEEARARAEAKLGQEKVRVIDPFEKFGSNFYSHRLSAKDVDEARKRGEIAGASVDSNGNISYWSTQSGSIADGAPSPSGRVGAANNVPPRLSEEAQQRLREREERRAARMHEHELRVAACGRLVADMAKLKRTLISEVMIDAVLLLSECSYEVDLAEYAVVMGDSTDNAAVRPINEAEGKKAGRAALAAALLMLEAEIVPWGSDDEPWSSIGRRHVRRLAELGYHTPSELETEQLDRGNDDEEAGEE